MSRQIITKKQVKGPVAQAGADNEDPYSTMILKMIPAEFVSVYLTAFNLVNGYDAKDDNSILQWIMFILMFVVLFFYLRYTGVEKRSQIIITMLSFVIWVFTLGGPFTNQSIGGYTPQFLGALFLPIYTFIAPALYKRTE